MGNYCTHFSIYQALDIEQRTLFFKDKQFDLDLWTFTIYEHTVYMHWTKSGKFQAKVLKDTEQTYKDQQFDIDLCPCDFKQGALVL